MNFSKAGILIFLLGMSLLSACGEIPITFSGESDNWSVHYEVSETNEKGKCARGDDRHIRYIGNKPIPKRLEYSISTESGDAPLFEQGIHTLGNGCLHADTGMEIEAIIKWNGKSETIPLTVE